MGGLNTAAIIHLSQSSYPFLGDLNELIVLPPCPPAKRKDISSTLPR